MNSFFVRLSEIFCATNRRFWCILHFIFLPPENKYTTPFFGC